MVSVDVFFCYSSVKYEVNVAIHSLIAMIWNVLRIYLLKHFPPQVIVNSTVLTYLVKLVTFDVSLVLLDFSGKVSGVSRGRGRPPEFRFTSG